MLPPPGVTMGMSSPAATATSSHLTSPTSQGSHRDKETGRPGKPFIKGKALYVQKGCFIPIGTVIRS